MGKTVAQQAESHKALLGQGVVVAQGGEGGAIPSQGLSPRSSGHMQRGCSSSTSIRHQETPPSTAPSSPNGTALLHLGFPVPRVAPVSPLHTPLS